MNKKQKIFKAQIKADKLFRKLHDEQMVWEGRCSPSWKSTPADSGHRTKPTPNLDYYDSKA